MLSTEIICLNRTCLVNKLPNILLPISTEKHRIFACREETNSLQNIRHALAKSGAPRALHERSIRHRQEVDAVEWKGKQERNQATVSN